MNSNTLTTVLNEVGAYIYTKDLNGKYTYANKLVLELFKLSLEEIVGKDDYSFFEGEDLQSLLENDRQVFSGKIIETEESLIIKQTGEIRYFIVVKKPLYDENKNIIGMFGISTDITERKRLEKKILEQKIFLDTILDNVDAHIYMKDENRVFRYVNSKVADLFRLPVEKIIGKKDIDVIPKDIADAFWESDKEVLLNNDKVITEEKFEDDGVNTYYWSIKIPYILEDKTPAIIGFSTDITKLKEQAQEIYEKDKMLYQQAKNAALGEMIENIAHQWRQPLSVISSITTGIQFRKEMGTYKEEDLPSELESITSSVKFLSETIDYFRGFMNKDNSETSFELEYIVNKTLELILVDLKSNDIKVVTSLDNIQISSFQNEFIQVLMNLITNAKDALIENEVEEKIIFIDVFKEDKKLKVKVKDTANGISSENLDRIFEPYFTTKHKSQGTGIGLFMCQQIVQKSLKGTLEVQNSDFEYQNKPYKGACFTITLPITK